MRPLAGKLALVTPGIRPAGADAGDQKRIMTPARAIAAGADYLVVGRPVVEAADPKAAAEAIVGEIAGVSEMTEHEHRSRATGSPGSISPMTRPTPNIASSMPSRLRISAGKFLVRGGPHHTVAGTPREHNVVIEFPSHDAAIACYRSPEYQDALQYLKQAGEVDLVIIGGYDGPQP